MKNNFLRYNSKLHLSRFRGGAKAYIFLATLCMLVLVIVSWWTPNDADDGEKFENIQAKWIQDFYDLARKQGTDKIGNRSHQHLYGLFLGPIRHKPVKLLEIGLGCDASHGPGKSLNLWSEYFGKTGTFDIIEHNLTCAIKFKSKVNKLFIGDQSSFALLNTIRENERYDVIVDDGSHKRKHQISSLIALWPCLKPHGVYIIEDIMTNYRESTMHADYDATIIDVLNHLITLMSKEVEFKNRELDLILRKLQKTLLSVTCFREACVLVKE
jgi:hypothetical protein